MRGVDHSSLIRCLLFEKSQVFGTSVLAIIGYPKFMIDAILFISGILLSSIGALLLKTGAQDLNFSGDRLTVVWQALLNWKLILGICSYFIPAVIWIYLYRKYPITFVQPIISLTYVVTSILAIYYLHEAVSMWRWAGIVAIILGVFFISRS